MHESNDFLFYFFLLNGLQRLDREEEVISHTDNWITTSAESGGGGRGGSKILNLCEYYKFHLKCIGMPSLCREGYFLLPFNE